jgi:UDP-N-acetyl-D-glucosamine dehydrogenase
MRLRPAPYRSPSGPAAKLLDRHPIHEHPATEHPATEHPAPEHTGPVLYELCILGLGYVGLPTALSLTSHEQRVLGVDISQARLAKIRSGEVDLLDDDRGRLESALRTGFLELTDDPMRLGEANAVLICVPTPIDHHRIPDLSLLRGACELAVAHARAGQTLILTSTSYAGTTRDLLIEPLRRRGLTPGEDIFVAFSPERIDPGNSTHPQHTVPRVVGGADPESTRRAHKVLEQIAPVVHEVSSAESAEMTKLYENTFRAVNIAFALEMSQAATALGLSIVEVIGAAATKPYGFMPFYPGPGVGGHCIPCDPHYLLWQLRAHRLELPTVDRAMATIAARPRVVAQRLRDLLADQGRPILGAKVLLVGASYKPGVEDTRESSAIQLVRDISALGADVSLWDPIAQRLDLEDGRVLHTIEDPRVYSIDAAVVHTVHPNLDHSWLEAAPIVLDASYRLDSVPDRAVV